jgi:predicted heme/steroid binding protein
MNLASWYDVDANATGINSAFAQAGIKAIRWPGGSWSDAYHWGQGGIMPFMCNTSGSGTGWGGYSSFPQFVSSIVKSGNYDLALTANYGSNATCTGGGDPAEAAAWVAEAVKQGSPASHVTIGNENYGSWEFDLHAKQHDAATYAASVTGASGYYAVIKAADSSAKVGVVVDANSSSGWDKIVLANAKASYDFVEFHFYPQGPGSESDTYLVHQAAQDLTANLNILKSELSAAGVANTPIYVGEMGSVYSGPGKQSWSITQGLYAGQTLGEMMNSGIVRSTWWIGFGNCDVDDHGAALGNMSSSLYGWQSFGAYNVFSDGPTDGPCGIGSGPLGTMSPTARAFQLFSNVAVTGETVLSTTVGGIPDVRAYAATHSGGTALVLFNLNDTMSEPVTVSLSYQSASTGVTVITYDKAIYDQTHSANPVWAAPSTANMGTQTLPLTLTLTPWSMNVVIIK